MKSQAFVYAHCALQGMTNYDSNQLEMVSMLRKEVGHQGIKMIASYQYMTNYILLISITYRCIDKIALNVFVYVLLLLLLSYYYY